MKDLIFYNIGQLLTLAPVSTKTKPINISEQDLGILENAWFYVKNGKIHHIGTGRVPKEYKNCNSFDLKKSYVMPSFIDCHTHLLYDGSRSHEFAAKLEGATYQEIAQQGGGIKYTVKCTRKSSDKRLKTLLIQRLNSFLECGTTTVEIKTGYALNVQEELRHLNIIKNILNKIPQQLKITSLSLHAQSDDYVTKSEYIEDVINNLLPKLKINNLAEYVDVFIEKGYYEPFEVENYINVAKDLGLKIRVHADEFSDLDGAYYAAKWGAISADHLEYSNLKSIEQMSKTDITAVLLPATSLYSKLKFTDAQKFLAKGVPVALASDFNPGSCQIYNMAFVATLGALYCNMTLAQAIAAITYVPAYSLSLHHTKGCLNIGYDADFVVYEDNILNHYDFISSFGQVLPSQVWINGVKYK